MEPHAFVCRKQRAFSKMLGSHYLQGERPSLPRACLDAEQGAEVVATAETAVTAAETRVAPLGDPTLYITHSMDIADEVGELEDGPETEEVEKSGGAAS